MKIFDRDSQVRSHQSMLTKAAGNRTVAADVSPRQAGKSAARSRAQPRPGSLLDTRVVYRGDNLEQLDGQIAKKLV